MSMASDVIALRAIDLDGKTVFNQFFKNKKSAEAYKKAFLKKAYMRSGLTPKEVEQSKKSDWIFKFEKVKVIK